MLLLFLTTFRTDNLLIDLDRPLLTDNTHLNGLHGELITVYH
jgi:hypothetical protein